MKRRDFITLLGAAAAWPLAARAQQPAMPVIGFLGSTSPEGYEGRLAALRQGLADIGYVEDRNVAMEFRWAENRYDRMPMLVADLMQRKAAVIIAFGAVNAALSAKAATTATPIVFLNGSDPVEFGLVASLNRPGGNVTGVTLLIRELSPKRMEILREIVPRHRRDRSAGEPEQCEHQWRNPRGARCSAFLSGCSCMSSNQSRTARSTPRSRLLANNTWVRSSRPAMRFHQPAQPDRGAGGAP